MDHCEIFYGEDALFIWNVLQKVNQVLITDRELYHYRVNDTSLSHQNWTPFKKGSGHKVWSEIVSDTEKKWIQFLDIAKARFAIEDMWGLYYASLCDYPYDEHINERQMNIRHNLKLIKESGLLSNGKLLAAYVLAYCYCLGKIFKFL